MISTLTNLATSTSSGLDTLKGIAMALSVKPIKYFIDSHFRDHVTPVPGSVVYCDLWLGAEHSGIYVGDGKISNIVVDGFASATVELDTPRSFTSKSILGRKIYVSCKKKRGCRTSSDSLWSTIPCG